MKKNALPLLFAATLAIGMTACSNTGDILIRKDTTGLDITTVNSVNQNLKSDIQDKESAYKAKLYFSDRDAMYVISEEHEVEASDNSLDNVKKAELIVKELLEGPQSKEAFPSIPKGTKLNSIIQENEALIVDLSKEFIQNSVGGSAGEIMAFAPIVLSLTELEEINQISFKIDGEIVKEYGGNFTLDYPFSREEFLDLIEK